MIPQQLETIIFDLGGVLIDWNPAYLYRKIFDDEAEMQYFLSEVCSYAWNEEQDAGRSWAEATGMIAGKFPHYRAEIEAYYQRWPEMLGGAIQPVVDILEQLHDEGRHRLYALTNWSAETWPLALERFGFLDRFEGILVSGQEKIRKPDPQIYRLLLERYAINPAGALFIDDVQRNVEGALACGLPAVRFRSAKQLRSLLLEEGILRSLPSR